EPPKPCPPTSAADFPRRKRARAGGAAIEGGAEPRAKEEGAYRRPQEQRSGSAGGSKSVDHAHVEDRGELVGAALLLADRLLEIEVDHQPDLFVLLGVDGEGPDDLDPRLIGRRDEERTARSVGPHVLVGTLFVEEEPDLRDLALREIEVAETDGGLLQLEQVDGMGPLEGHHAPVPVL